MGLNLESIQEKKMLTKKLKGETTRRGPARSNTGAGILPPPPNWLRQGGLLGGPHRGCLHFGGLLMQDLAPGLFPLGGPRARDR